MDDFFLLVAAGGLELCTENGGSVQSLHEKLAIGLFHQAYANANRSRL